MSFPNTSTALSQLGLDARVAEALGWLLTLSVTQ